MKLPAIYKETVKALSHTWKGRGTGKKRPSRVFSLKRGEIYMAKLSDAKGAELYPVLIIQTDRLNRLKYPSTVVVPCTQDGVSNNLLRVQLPENILFQGKRLSCMIDAVRMVNNMRFMEKIGRVPSSAMRSITRKISLLVGN